MWSPTGKSTEEGVTAVDILVVYKKNFEEVHDKALENIKEILDKLVTERGIKVDYTVRETVRKSDFLDRDLAIILGGDGTLTSIVHSVDSKTLVMGVNSHPREINSEGSYGFYMGSEPNFFAKDIIDAIEGRAIVNILPRLQAEIETPSGKKIISDPALNDLLVANTHQYQPSKYRIQRINEQGSDEFDVIQKSSGCLFSTFLGQGAWFRHVANIEGFTFPLEEVNEKYLFVSRDLPRSERMEDGSYWSWTDKPTKITSDMHRGYVVSDGWEETHFTRGSTVTINLNGPSLQLLTFRSPIHDRVAHWIKS